MVIPFALVVWARVNLTSSGAVRLAGKAEGDGLLALLSRGVRAPRYRIVRSRVKGRALGEHALAGDVVYLEPDPVGVQEGQRVVARRPRTSLGCSDHSRAECLQEGIQLVDVLSASRAEAEMVKAGAIWDMPFRRVARIRPAYCKPCPPAHVIHEVLGAMDRSQPEVRHQLIVKGLALLEAIHTQLNMGDTVDLHTVIVFTAWAAARTQAPGLLSGGVQSAREASALLEPGRDDVRSRPRVEQVEAHRPARAVVRIDDRDLCAAASQRKCLGRRDRA
jgi:hypothetical protein